MIEVQQARRVEELAEVPLSRLYRDAVEYYLAGRPQRDLLERHRARMSRDGSGPEVEGLLCVSR